MFDDLDAEEELELVPQDDDDGLLDSEREKATTSHKAPTVSTVSTFSIFNQIGNKIFLNVKQLQDFFLLKYLHVMLKNIYLIFQILYI